MRRHRLLPIPLAPLLALAVASPASALDWNVVVTDFAFTPKGQSIRVGDTVVWRFADSGHTTTARGGQADRWNSGPTTSPQGGEFRHTFFRPGRFQYYCTPHPFMKGVIEVGEDRESDTVDRFRSRRTGANVKVSFELNEPATATYRLRGPERKTVRRGRLKTGRHSLRVRNLEPGRYRGQLKLSDDFDNVVVRKKSFVVP